MRDCVHNPLSSHAVFKTNGFKGSIYLIFEYLDHDLWGLHDRIQKQSASHAAMPIAMAKSLTRQMLQGLAHCHNQSILHRDLKASNLLISRDGVLKLADFGLARPYVTSTGRVGELTYRVCTLWYRCELAHPYRVRKNISCMTGVGRWNRLRAAVCTRSGCDYMSAALVTLHRPPELLLGSQSYGPEVDIWSAGCILYEMVAGRPLFGGNKEQIMLSRIMDTLGPLDWDGAGDIPAARSLKQCASPTPRWLCSELFRAAGTACQIALQQNCTQRWRVGI